MPITAELREESGFRLFPESEAPDSVICGHTQELLVLYRSKPSGIEWVSALRQRIMGPRDHEKSPRYRRRNQIVLRVFRDVPLPTWKIVFPEKLLQFRPLDSARADIFSLAGEISFLSSPEECGGPSNRDETLGQHTRLKVVLKSIKSRGKSCL